MEQIVASNGMKLWCETFGDGSDPAVLLIMGVGTQGIAWETSFCELLAERGRHVIRYDQRDTGKSTVLDFDVSPYTLADMADDAVGLLDALGIERAHVVGASMGGMVAQEMAINHPERVRSLISVISTPAVYDGAASKYSGDLPLMDDAVMDVLMEIAMGDEPETLEDELDNHVKMSRALVGPDFQPFDEDTIRAIRRLELERATDIDAASNHNLAIMESADRAERLARVTVPTLVIHGSADPMFPLPHGEATAAAIPGARLVVLDGMGHELPDYPVFVEMIAEHTASA